MSRQLELALPSGVIVPLSAELVAELEAAVRAWHRQNAHRRDLAGEIETYLAAQQGASTIEIARGIRARDHDVRSALKTDPRFRRDHGSQGGSGRATRWVLAESASEPVLAPETSMETTTGGVS